MILDEQGMQRAQGLARELVRAEKEKEREQTRQAINNFKDAISGAYDAIGTVALGIGTALENAFGKERSIK